jgi:hypothetical protein
VTSSERIAALLHEAAETHHIVYRITDGDDPDWASWYANWLLDLSELPGLLGNEPVRSHLVHALVQLDRDYTSSSPEANWEAYYAERLVDLSLTSG